MIVEILIFRVFTLSAMSLSEAVHTPGSSDNEGASKGLSTTMYPHIDLGMIVRGRTSWVTVKMS